MWMSDNIQNYLRLMNVKKLPAFSLYCKTLVKQAEYFKIYVQVLII